MSVGGHEKTGWPHSTNNSRKRSVETRKEEKMGSYHQRKKKEELGGRINAKIRATFGCSMMTGCSHQPVLS